MKEIYEMKGAGRSVRGIAQELDVSRNTVRRYLNSPEAMRPKPRPRRGSKLDPYAEHIDRRMAEGLENCRVLEREVRALGYQGSYSTVVQYVRPRRQHKQPEATMRFETAPGEQAQVDWGSLPYIGRDGKRHRVWVFVMTLGWSRACYAELVRKTDTAAFIQCHVNAFEYLGGVPQRCLYDNAKVVTLGRDEEKRPIWNRRMLDFALRVGFEARLCQPYRAQTKGKVESGVKYVRRNMWPSISFTDDADLNRQALEWCDVVANARVHGTTHRIPGEMLVEELPHLGKLPDRATLAPCPAGIPGFRDHGREEAGMASIDPGEGELRVLDAVRDIPMSSAEDIAAARERTVSGVYARLRTLCGPGNGEEDRLVEPVTVGLTQRRVDRWQVELVLRVVRRFRMEDWVRVWCVADDSWHGSGVHQPSRGWVYQPAYVRNMGRRAWEKRVAASPWAAEGGQDAARILGAAAEWPGMTVEWARLVLGEGKTGRRAQNVCARLTELGLLARWRVGSRYRYRASPQGLSMLAALDGTSMAAAWKLTFMEQWVTGNVSEAHEYGLLDLMRDFLAAGLPVAAGWRDWEDLGCDGGIAPDGLVLLRFGPYGSGWHYVEYERSARSPEPIARKLSGYDSLRRSNRWPVLVVCRNDLAEANFQRAGQPMGIPMLTTTVRRLSRHGAVDNPDCWSVYGRPAAIG